MGELELEERVPGQASEKVTEEVPEPSPRRFLESDTMRMAFVGIEHEEDIPEVF